MTPSPHTKNRPNYRRAILNDVERRLVKFLVDGESNPVIAGRLKVSETTIVTYFRRLYKKIGAKNKHHAAALVVKHDYSFDLNDRFLGVPMRINSNLGRVRKINKCPELW